MKIMLASISRTLDEAQIEQQAGFRRGFGCIQTVSKVIEICPKYHPPPVLTFVNIEKAFDSVETNTILSALINHGIHSSFLRILVDTYDGCKTTVQLFHRSFTIPIGKGCDRAIPCRRSCPSQRCSGP